jgi:SAM-dependent methyltransferase
MADHFDSALGIDVAPSMIALAREHNRYANRCAYEVNDRPDLSRWPDAAFDLVYTGRVLQHMEPRYAAAYIREFLRVLAPGGYLSFDVPSESGDAISVAEGTVPTSAMRALVEVEASGGSALDAPPRRTMRFRLAITNVSDLAWHATEANPINVGNHWFDQDGGIVAYDDARVKLPAVLAPGDRVPVEIVVTTPAEPGRYRLQFDVVQEGVAWFATCGSQLSEVQVSVGDGAAAASSRQDLPALGSDESSDAGPASFDPVMEMHAVPRAEVEAILAEAGARLLDVRRVSHCGPLWLAYRYDVTK